MNRVILGGTIENAPEIRSTDSGKSIGTFRIDTGSGWFTVTAWENLAANLPPKGTYILVDGKLRTRSYDKDGEKRYITEVNASSIEVVGPSKVEPDNGSAEALDLGF